jgi:Ca2+-binding EF-hand superfamily protein
MNTLGENLEQNEAREVFEKYSGEKNYLSFDDFLKIFKSSEM